MTQLSYQIPVLGNPSASEDPKIHDALQQIQTVVNGELDSGNIVDGSIAFTDLIGVVQHALHTVGDLKMTGVTTAPTGWLMCDGSLVSRTTYNLLFAAIGTAYGAGDGSTTFGVPDLQGRMPVGKGTNADVDTLGKNDGVVVGGRKPRHYHAGVGQYAQTHPNEIGSNTDRFQTGYGGTDRSVDGTRVGDIAGPLDGPAFVVVNFMIFTGQ